MRSEMTVGVELSAATLFQASRQSRRRGGWGARTMVTRGSSRFHSGPAWHLCPVQCIQNCVHSTHACGQQSPGPGCAFSCAQVLGEEDRTARRAVVRNPAAMQSSKNSSIIYTIVPTTHKFGYTITIDLSRGRRQRARWVRGAQEGRLLALLKRHVGGVHRERGLVGASQEMPARDAADSGSEGYSKREMPRRGCTHVPPSPAPIHGGE